MVEVRAQHIDLGYDGEVLVKDLNFEVYRGNYLCILGENGSGKSTLMRTILHLQKPLHGEISFGEGVEVGGIGYLPQQTVVQRDFPASVREIVLSGRQRKRGFHAFYNKEDKRIADENMERLGITELKDRCYRELSGGQQQRVLLARALCAGGRILLLDEPVSGLDPKVTQEMYQIIEQLNKEGITIIMISHDTEAALKYATHVLHIGSELFFGTAEEYRKSKTGRLYLPDGGSEA